MRILGFESSCDETAAAVVEDGQFVHSNVVHTQIELHQRFGGVVPEIASRDHLRRAMPVVERALEDAGMGPGDIDGLAVTQGPGLVGSLLVGLQTIKALAYALEKPIVFVNHVEAHTDAVFLRSVDPAEAVQPYDPPPFPHVALAVSGGHSSLYLVRDHGRHELVGYTMDDAAGEAFDKVAKLLGLPYPGGVSIDRLSEKGDPEAVRFPRPRIHKKPHLFSFSGLKTAVRYHLDGLKKDGKLVEELSESELGDIAASFQEAVCDVLIERSLTAAATHCPPGAGALVVAGGVAANRRLRALFTERAAAAGHSLHLAPRPYCTDNAAMIAGLGYHLHQRGEAASDYLAQDVFSNVVTRGPNLK